MRLMMLTLIGTTIGVGTYFIVVFGAAGDAFKKIQARCNEAEPTKTVTRMEIDNRQGLKSICYFSDGTKREFQ
jgi:hypothetical protein